MAATPSSCCRRSISPKRTASGSRRRSTTSLPQATRSRARSGRSARRWSTTPCVSRLKAHLRHEALLTLRIRPGGRLEFLAELGELIGADVADGPEIQAAFAPAADVEALDGLGTGLTARGVRGLRHEQIDHMRAP